MKRNEDILGAIDHRPWEMPAGQWTYYQEWNRSLFLHWKVPADVLRPLVPAQLELDVYNGETWVSLVAFTMEQIRPRKLPAFHFIFNFDEVNLRTYVRTGDRPGVYFLNIEAGKSLSVFIARSLSGLPYERASILRKYEPIQRYTATNFKRGFHLDASFTIGEKKSIKSGLDNFLTEKYCLYLEQKDKLFRYDIHHKPWNVHSVKFIDLQVDYKIGEYVWPEKPDLVHYSAGVEVVAWNKVPVFR